MIALIAMIMKEIMEGKTIGGDQKDPAKNPKFGRWGGAIEVTEEDVPVRWEEKKQQQVIMALCKLREKHVSEREYNCDKCWETE